MKSNKNVRNLSTTMINMMAMTASCALIGCLEVQDKGTTDLGFGASGGGSGNSGFTVVQDPNAPAASPTPTPVQVPPNGDIIGFEGMLINGGDTKTNNPSLFVKFTTYLPKTQLKLSQNKTCTGGNWQNFVSSMDYNSTQTNGVLDLSVQYMDTDGEAGPCYSASILVDSSGPDIVFASYPTSMIPEGQATEIIYDVSDLGSGVAQVECKLNDVVKPCSSGRNIVSAPYLSPANYVFSVSAVDNLGNSSSKSISWTVTSKYKRLASSYDVTSNNKVDILIVVDNSGSMQYEQQSMAKRVGRFIEVLRGLDWQIAVTTTDPRNVNLGDGRFVPLYGKSNEYILTSAVNETEAQYTLGMTLQRPETGSGDEQAIKATYRVVERSLTASSNPFHSKFFRSGAQFATLVISDEDESANGPQNDPELLVKFVNSSFQGQKAFSFHSIITKPGDVQCKNTYGATFGDRYHVLTQMTKGLEGSVCASDYAGQVMEIANGVRNLLKTLTLSCQPLPELGIKVIKDGVEYKAAYTLQGVNLEFGAALESGKYSVEYSCLK